MDLSKVGQRDIQSDKDLLSGNSVIHTVLWTWSLVLIYHRSAYLQYYTTSHLVTFVTFISTSITISVGFQWKEYSHMYKIPWLGVIVPWFLGW